MSKYNSLWQYVAQQCEPSLLLTFEEAEQIAGVPMDHSFLTFKKELLVFGWQVGKISMKNKTVRFERVDSSKAHA